MKISSPSYRPSSRKGSSLIEAVIAVGVLSVAVPLVFGTMAGTGESASSAQAETRSSWIVPACVEELQHAMRGESNILSTLTPGKAFPSGGGITAIAFTSEGRPLGKVDQGGYEKGMRTMANEPVRFITSLSGKEVITVKGTTPNLQVKIVLEYPASAPADKRQKLEFFTRMP